MRCWAGVAPVWELVWLNRARIAVQSVLLGQSPEKIDLAPCGSATDRLAKTKEKRLRDRPARAREFSEPPEPA